MTAIAAVIALSSTPLLAQDAGVPDPVADTVIDSPVSTTPDPLAPDPAATTTAAPEVAPATKAPTKKVAKAAPVARSAPSTARTSQSRVATAAPAAPIAAPAAESPAETPLPIAEAAPPAAEPAAPLAADSPPVAQADTLEDMAPIAGAAGLGLLALAGAGLAMRRRRRRREDEEFEANQWALNHAEAEPESEPVMAAPEPAFARNPAPVPDPIQRAESMATALPAGFDISRFGRHVQAAYRGPTPDNPSLSLKNRLRRASFFDQQERRAAEQGTPVPKPAQDASKPAQPAWMSRKANEAEFMFRPATRSPALKTAFQK